MIRTNTARDRRGEYSRRENRIGCRVWEQSGIGVKEGLAWNVTNAAINEAVKQTYAVGISDDDWISRALDVFWRATEYEDLEIP